MYLVGDMYPAQLQKSQGEDIMHYPFLFLLYVCIQ